MQPACVRADPLLLGRSPPAGARDQEQQVQLRQKLRELPALLRSGLTLRRKNSATGGRVSGRARDPVVHARGRRVALPGVLRRPVGKLSSLVVAGCLCSATLASSAGLWRFGRKRMVGSAVALEQLPAAKRGSSYSDPKPSCALVCNA
uniref:Uncharacterized protein n=1 Tax=Sphaerodactylus townsendi TaxID=933632 RepID=A0ACB8FV86_9SAUR